MSSTGTSMALAPVLATSSIDSRRMMEMDLLLRSGRILFDEKTPPEVFREKNEGKDLILLPTGAFLLSRELKGNDIKVIRTVRRAELEVLLEGMEKEDIGKYTAICDLTLGALDTVPGLDETNVHETIARALEILSLWNDGLLSDRDIPQSDRDLAAEFSKKLVSRHRHDLFTGMFFDGAIREMKFRLAVAGAVSPRNKRTMAGLYRMKTMLTAYQEILSEKGLAIKREITETIEKIETGDAAALKNGNRLAALMPDPDKIDFDIDNENNWLNWFSDTGDLPFSVIGDGCRFPCLHCVVGNGEPAASYVPFPVVIRALMKKKMKIFGGWARNEVFDWRDPFFGVGYDAVISYLVEKRPEVEISASTTGWRQDDEWAQRTAERTAAVLAAHGRKGAFNVSFHLALREPDIIAETYANGGTIPKKLINEYAARYGNIFRTLGPAVGRVNLYRKIDSPIEEYSRAADEAFAKARENAGAGWNISGSGNRVECGAGINELNIYGDGRGHDFSRRLRQALKKDPACLGADTAAISTIKFTGWLFPRVIVTDLGETRVESFKSDGKIILSSTLEELSAESGKPGRGGKGKAAAKGTPALLIREMSRAEIFDGNAVTARKLIFLASAGTGAKGTFSRSAVYRKLKILLDLGIVQSDGKGKYYLAGWMKRINAEEFLKKNPGLDRAAPGPKGMSDAAGDILGILSNDPANSGDLDIFLAGMFIYRNGLEEKEKGTFAISPVWSDRSGDAGKNGITLTPRVAGLIHKIAGDDLAQRVLGRICQEAAVKTAGLDEADKQWVDSISYTEGDSEELASAAFKEIEKAQETIRKGGPDADRYSGIVERTAYAFEAMRRAMFVYMYGEYNEEKLHLNFVIPFYLTMIINGLPEKRQNAYFNHVRTTSYIAEETSSEEKRRVLDGLGKMKKMFAAYGELLSARGGKIAAEVDAAIAGIEAQETGATVKGKQLVSLMPDPDNIDIKKGGADNWFNWFDLDQVKAEKLYALGKGCLFPCQHCGRGNGLSETRAMPLPVVIKMLIAQEKRTTFAGWYANDVFDWEDPFFGTRFDAVAGFMARENAGKRFFVTTRGWYPADARAQRTAEKVAKIVAAHEVGGFNISFHLGHPRMDIIKAVYDNGGKIPESVVNEYAEYYGNIFRTLGTSVQMVYLYRIEPGFAEYNNATDRALKLAAKIAGRPELAEIGSESDLGAVTREETIDEWGRGKDFMNRLKMAMARDPRCLEPNKRQFMDSEPLGWGIPTVSINDKGEVKVHGGKNEKNIVLTSSMDELDPVPDKRKALTDLVIAVDRIGVSAEKSLKDDGMEAVAAQAPENVKGKSMIVYADDVLKSGCAFDMEKTIKKLASASGKFTGGKVVIFAREEGYALVLEELLVKAGLDREKNIILITEKELSERKGRIENDGAEISAIAAVSRSLGAGEIMGVIRGGVKRPDELNEYAETKLKIPVAVIGAEDAIYSFSQAVRFLVETYAAKGSAGWVRMLPPARTITADMRKMYEEYRRLLRVMVAA